MSHVSPSNDRADGMGQDAAARHVRSSVLLLCGRFIALTTNFGVQVITIRYLTKLDYGIFAFAMALVEMTSMLAALGMDRAISRFVPLYHEKQEYSKLSGAILLAIGSVCGIGLSIVAASFGLQGVIARTLELSPTSLIVLLTLILLTPVGALDWLLFSMFTAFASSRSILVRRYVIGPALKLMAVCAVVLAQGDVRWLATAHVVAGVIGLLMYSVMLVFVLRRQGLFRRFTLRGLHFPMGEILGYGIPVLGGDVAILIRAFLIVVCLEVYHSAASVAEFRAVLPIARLNAIVLTSFSFLFTPIASRLFARDDHRHLNEMYWRSTIWIMVLTFPVLATCLAMPRPITILFFGEQYAAAGTILAVLAVGYYTQASLGFTDRTLQVLGKVNIIVAIDALLTLLSVALILLVIPTYSARGGAVCLTAIMVTRGLCNQAALGLTSNVRAFDVIFAKIAGCVAVAAAALVTVRWFWAPPIYAMASLVVFATLLILRINWNQLQFDGVFPELRRFRFIQRRLGSAP